MLLSDFGEDSFFEHPCDPHSCGAPCRVYAKARAQELKVLKLQNKLQQELSLYRGLKTAFNRTHDRLFSALPREIVTSIVHFCLPVREEGVYRCTGTWPEEGETRPTNGRVLFALGAVCAAWREIIWATPRLWRKIQIPYRLEDMETTVEIAVDWVRRAGAAAALSVAVYPVEHFVPTQDLFELVRALAPLGYVVSATAGRWAAVELELPAQCLAAFGGATPAGAHLREVRIRANNGHYHNEIAEDVILTCAEGREKSAPTRVELDGVHAEDVDIAWGNATHVKGQALTQDDIMTVLMGAPQLEELVLDHPVEWHEDHMLEDGIDSVMLIDHGALRRPSVSTSAGDTVDSLLFTVLTLPRLEALCLSVFRRAIPVDILTTCLHRSACALRTLEIGAVVEEETLLVLLRAVPSLRRLVLTPSAAQRFAAGSFFRRLVDTAVLAADRDKEEAEAEGGARRDFLPELCHLEYHAENKEECAEIWDLIPALFAGEESTRERGRPRPRRRPLRTLKVSIKQRPVWRHQGARWTAELAALSAAAIREPTLHRIGRLNADPSVRADVSVEWVSPSGKARADWMRYSNLAWFRRAKGAGEDRVTAMYETWLDLMMVGEREPVFRPIIYMNP